MQIREKIPESKLTLPDCPHIIIDTDAGGDDPQAIILAIHEAKKGWQKDYRDHLYRWECYPR